MRIASVTAATLTTAGLLAAPATAGAAPGEVLDRAVQLTADGQDIGMVVGGTGTPIPGADYIAGAMKYIDLITPGASPDPVFTPEGGSPLYTGVKSLTFDQSFSQGTTILTADIEKAVHAGDHVTVYGESQSSTIAGMVMPNLVKDGISPDDVKFVLVGDPSNPDGGLLERFAGLSLPSIGISFSGGTPSDTAEGNPFDTTIYTQEYDGFADFPKYPLNFLADLNAFLGIQYVHPTYRDLDIDQSTGQPDGAIKLDPTEGYDGHTSYYMIPMAQDQVLPLLRPLEAIPLIGKPLADLLNPDLTQLVNLGYDNPDNEGWDVGQPNVATPFGLFPAFSQVETAVKNMGDGTEAGIKAFVNDLTHLGTASSASSLLGELTGSGAGLNLPSFTDIVNGLTGALSTGYSLALPTADVLTALALNMPAYDISLFAENILTNPLDAVGLPVAADVGLVTLAAGIEFMALEQTISAISADLTGLF